MMSFSSPDFCRRTCACLSWACCCRSCWRSAAINGFAVRLAAQPEVAEVQVVKLPLNVNPALSLSGNTLDNPEQSTGTADFKLLLVLKPGL